MAAGFLGKSIWILALAAALVIFLQPDVVDALKCFQCDGIDCHKGKEPKDCKDRIKLCSNRTTISNGKITEESYDCADERQNNKEGCTDPAIQLKICYCSTNGCNGNGGGGGAGGAGAGGGTAGNLRGWSLQIQILTVSALLFVVASVSRVGVGAQQ